MKNNYGKMTLPEGDPAIEAVQSPLLHHGFILGDICGQLATTGTASLSKAEDAWKQAQASTEACFICERPTNGSSRLQQKPVCDICATWLMEKADQRRAGLDRILVEVSRPDKPRFVGQNPHDD